MPQAEWLARSCADWLALAPISAIAGCSLAHMPAMADADRLAGERVSLEGGEEQSHVGHVLDRGELLVHRLGQHDLLDYALLADAERLCLLGDLLLDERRLDETRANDIGAHAMRG